VTPKKTIYVKEADMPTWERYERAVTDNQAAESVSAMVADAMTAYLAPYGDQGDGLYVIAPDEARDSVQFGAGRVALLGRFGRGEWILHLDEDEFGKDANSPYEIERGDGTVGYAVTRARRHIAMAREDKERQTATFKRLEVECDTHTEAFEGRWLVEPDEDFTGPTKSDFDNPRHGWFPDAYYGVALTKRGRFAVYQARSGDRQSGRLTVYESLEDASEEMPRSVVAAARAELTNTTPIIERDI